MICPVKRLLISLALLSAPWLAAVAAPAVPVKANPPPAFEDTMAQRTLALSTARAST